MSNELPRLICQYQRDLGNDRKRSIKTTICLGSSQFAPTTLQTHPRGCEQDLLTHPKTDFLKNNYYSNSASRSISRIILPSRIKRYSPRQVPGIKGCCGLFLLPT